MPRLLVHGFTISLDGYGAGWVTRRYPDAILHLHMASAWRWVMLFVVFVGSTRLVGQEPAKLKIEEWMEKRSIKLNAPSPPAGFSFFYDCQMRPAYRRDSGDTITLYTWGGSMAEDLDRFKETVKSEEFNVLRYPTKTQKNETVVVVQMGRRDFIWRNDTLYVLDSYNAERGKKYIDLMDQQMAGSITEKEYEAQRDALKDQDFGFVPRYKAIYFSGIFESAHSYTFGPTENFRRETVSWTGASFSEGKKIFEINLETHTDGRYRFSEDMKMLETANCFH